jgi:Etoposide-induced protein 2.4 (EI24)
MNLLLDSFWRAVAYCLHPRVILLSLLPLLLMAALALGLGYFYWEASLDAVRAGFESWALLATMFHWLEGIGLPNLKSVLAPLVVVFLSTPVIVVLALLMVAAFMTPSMLGLVAARRFPLLERKHGGSFFGSMVGALWATALALVALLVSIPLWFVPPLVLIVPPLIWGWLTYRVMSVDVLAEHASTDERRELMRRHRSSLLGMGVLTGYLGAAPSVVWASGAIAIVFAPVLVPVAVWIYTLVFAFSALWFAHFGLTALQALRRESEVSEPLPAATAGATENALALPPADAAGAPSLSPWARS